MAVDTNKMEQFLGKFVNDLGAAVHAGLVVIGDRLGLYKALAAGPLLLAGFDQIAGRTETLRFQTIQSPGRIGEGQGPIRHLPAGRPL